MIEQSCYNKRGIYIANAVVVPDTSSVPVWILNTTTLPLTVYKGDTLANIEELNMENGSMVASLTNTE